MAGWGCRTPWWKCKSRSLRWLEAVHDRPCQGKGGKKKSFLSHDLGRGHQKKLYPLQCPAPLLEIVVWSWFSVIMTHCATSLVLSPRWPLPTSSPGSQRVNLSTLSFIRELQLISCMKSHLAPVRWSSRQHLGKSTWEMRFVLSLTGSNQGQDWRTVTVAGKMNSRLLIYWQFLRTQLHIKDYISALFLRQETKTLNQEQVWLRVASLEEYGCRAEAVISCSCVVSAKRGSAMVASFQNISPFTSITSSLYSLSSLLQLWLKPKVLSLYFLLALDGKCMAISALISS